MTKLNSSDDRTKKKSAIDVATGRLSSRMRTECEVRRYLQQREYSQEEIQEAVMELKDYGYLNDAHYCGEYYRYAKTKGKADRRILQELIQKGVSAETAKNAIARLREEEEQVLTEHAMAEGQNAGQQDAGAYRQEGVQHTKSDDWTVAGQVAVKMAKAQIASGRALDEKFLAKVGRRLAGLGYESGMVYEVLGRLRRVEKRRNAAEE